jgi:predicted dinucleotide-binding enzyme
VTEAAAQELVLLALPCWRCRRYSIRHPDWHGRILADATNPFVTSIPCSSLISKAEAQARSLPNMHRVVGGCVDLLMHCVRRNEHEVSRARLDYVLQMVAHRYLAVPSSTYRIVS